jgi:hypothetical protein
MNSINEDGTRNCVENWFPNFFDISEVVVPAAREAWTLSKVAAYKIDANGPKVRRLFEPSDINIENIMDKRESKRSTVVPKVRPVEQDSPPIVEKKNISKPGMSAQIITTRALISADSASKIPFNLLSDLKSSFGVPNTVKALTSNGIIMNPGECKSLIGNEKFPKIEGKVTTFPKGIMDFIRGIISKRSMFSPAIKKRVIAIKILKGKNNNKPTKRIVTKVGSMDKNVQDYYSYLGNITQEDMKDICSDPSVMGNLYSSNILNALTAIKIAGLEGPDYLDFWLPFLLELESRGVNYV